MFDLPVNKKNKKKYSKFRRFLLNDGYDMIAIFNLFKNL
jgi:CRISPR/Cas system-associated protein endoribonuclease Cas2